MNGSFRCVDVSMLCLSYHNPFVDSCCFLSQAYSALGGLSHIPVLTDPDVVRIAGLHNVSAAQVALRWVIQRQAAFVTAGTKRDYLAADLDVFSFALSQSEMELLNAK